MKWWIGASLCLILFVIIATFAYIKTSFLMKGVQIEAVIDHNDSSPIANIKGKASNAVYLSLNGREIFIDKDGSFSETIALLPGFQIIDLKAEDKFGNTAEKTFQVMHEEDANTVALNENKIIN